MDAVPFNFSWIEDGRIAGMARPRPEDLPWLQEQGVTALLSLTLEPAEPGDLELLHLPVPDMHPPSLDDLHAAVGFMREVVEDGGAVAVHCMAGIGRTGTMLAAYLVGAGLPADEAIRRVRRLRPGSIETRAQEEIVHRYAELMGTTS